ncbi:hypothetical protein CTheo_4830 [Ceratobasidium theobromae]|uniref:DSBA-like thioredoxin domain-containing protein n=1 Tax=Ceratobasidium theobromae TaxID=1582974 RepID=A0A5N5QJT0_9AGAM|nr:hypothetical protein CTheo_4830 [Ceratobasidium theobromae]
MKGRVINLTITSDIVCPWCYIAMLELRKAIARAYIAQLPLRFHIEYKPFESRAMLSGGIDQAPGEFQGRVYSKLATRAQNFGISLRQPAVTLWKTVSANRLLLFAYQSGGQNSQQALLTELFRAHHVKGEDLEDFQVLAEYCEKIGIMSREDAFMFLESNCLLDEVEQTIDIGRYTGVSVVPLTVIDNKWSLVGAQSSDVYYQIFLRLSQGKEL